MKKMKTKASSEQRYKLSSLKGTTIHSLNQNNSKKNNKSKRCQVIALIMYRQLSKDLQLRKGSSKQKMIN